MRTRGAYRTPIATPNGKKKSRTKMPTASRMEVPMSAALMSRRGTSALPSKPADLSFRKDQAHFDRQPDALKIGGFAHDVDRPQVQGFFEQFLVLDAGQYHDPAGVALRAKCAQHLDTVHAGHVEVQHDEMRPLPLRQQHGSRSVLRGEDAIAVVGQVLREHVAYLRVIVNDQDGVLLL